MSNDEQGNICEECEQNGCGKGRLCLECEEEIRYEQQCEARELEYYDDGDDRSMFADPGGRSALRAETPDNPRNMPCPNCEQPNRLTPADVARGYQCDSCADAIEGGYGY